MDFWLGVRYMQECIQCFVAILFATAAILFFATFPLSAQAQSGGIAISPSTYEPSQHIEPGETLSFDLEVRNRRDQAHTFYLTPRNISGTHPGGVPIFTRDIDRDSGYELGSWLSFSDEGFTLESGERAVVPITIQVPEYAEPGSHFGGINVSTQPPEVQETGAAIAIGVTNIVTMRIAGDATEQARIRSLATDRYIYGSVDVQFTARVMNEGNVLIRPVGILEISNMFGNEVASILVNESREGSRPNGVFPGDEREFRFAWSDDGLGFGRYVAVLSMNYGSDGINRTMSNSVTFWVLPRNIILPGLAVFAVVLIVAYVGVRWYVRSAIQQYHGGARRVAKRKGKQHTSFLSTLVIVFACVTVLFIFALLLLFA